VRPADAGESHGSTEAKAQTRKESGRRAGPMGACVCVVIFVDVLSLCFCAIVIVIFLIRCGMMTVRCV